MKVLAFAGSLRAASYNRALLRAAVDLAPEGLAVTIHELAELPLFNDDLDVDGGPAPVAAFRSAIAAADALLIATPEYNHGPSGVIKNALDWASRPPGKSVLAGKPVTVIGASPGAVGAARAQTLLEPMLLGCGCRVYNRGQFALGHAADRFDAEGALTDQESCKRLVALLEGLVAWTRSLSG